MSRMNAGIILGGQSPDMVNALTTGVLSGQAVNDARHQQSYRNALTEHGSAAYSGDQDARNALAAFDPAAIQALDAGDLAQDQTRLGMDATRLGMDATRQQMQINQERLQMARQSAARAAQAQAVQLSAAQAAEEAADMARIVNGLQLAEDETQYNQFLQANEIDPAEFPYDQRDMLAATVLGAQEVLELRASQEPQVPELPASVRALEYQLEQGGVVRGSPEWQQAMLGQAQGQPEVVINNGNQVPDIGTIPQGFETFINDEGRREMRPVLGGPEDTSAQEAAAVTQQQQVDGIVSEDIGRALDIIQNSPALSTGFLGNIARGIPGTNASDLSALITTIEANVGFDTLQAMRNASPTGGALGAISERELALLTSTLGSLSQTQSSAQLTQNLERLEQQIQGIVHGDSAALPETNAIAADPWDASQGPPTTVEAVQSMTIDQITEAFEGVDMTTLPDGMVEVLIERLQGDG